MSTKETITTRLQEVRKQKGVTQLELAEAVGVTRQTIISIEKGNYVPSVLLALKISQYFDTEVEQLFTINKK